VRVDIGVEPKARRRIPAVAFVAPAISAVIIGYFAVGSVSLVVAALVFALVVLVAWAGPRVNSRVYGQNRDTPSDFTASAIVNRVPGQVRFHASELIWTPRRVRSDRKPIQLSFGAVTRATLQPLPGVPRSCRVRLQQNDGSTVELTVFSRCDRIEQALRAATS
jgi:hypothetical protein